MSGWLGALGETVLDVAGAVPAYGVAVHGIEAAYHGGAAALSDDPREAARHKALALDRAASGAMGLIPAVGHYADAVNGLTRAAVDGTATVRRGMGASDEEAPTFDEAVVLPALTGPNGLF